MGTTTLNTLPFDNTTKQISTSQMLNGPTIECDNSKCMNGGLCRKDTMQRREKLTKIFHDVPHSNATYDSKDFDFCICRPGFTGLRCEHNIEICGDDEHY